MRDDGLTLQRRTAARRIPSPRRARLRPPQPGRRRARWGSVLVPALLGAVFLWWNLGRSPDTQYDEVVYSEAARSVAQDWRLTWEGRPVFVHPPVSFLLQAAWIRLLGLQVAPLPQVIDATRLLAATAAVLCVVLVALLAGRLARGASPARTLVLVVLVGALAATDPVLLRYGRLAVIEPFALAGCLVALHAAMSAPRWRAGTHVVLVGLATGVALLTKEITVFLLAAPVLHAAMSRDRALLARAAAALATGIALWGVFAVWAASLGLLGQFVDVKTATLRRLLGLVQITGWNRPGVSFVDAVLGQAAQYATSYVLLAGGGLALLWLLVHRAGDGARWLLAWSLASYAFAAYVVLLGTLNEQFFVYVLPAAVVAVVLVGDALARRVRVRALVALVALAVVVVAATSWGRSYRGDDRGVERLVAGLDASQPSCAVLNASGDVEKFSFLSPARPVSDFASGPGALSHGVQLFVLSDKDALTRSGNASAQLNAWVRAHGTRLAAYPSTTYRGLELWRVPLDDFDPRAGVEPLRNGALVLRDGSRCGAFAVTDSGSGPFFSTWTAAGGKAVLGAPLTSVWEEGGRAVQVFSGTVLTSAGDGRLDARPVVRELAASAPQAYRQAGLPGLSAGAPGRIPRQAGVLTDPLLTAAATGELGRLLGPALGPPAAADGARVRQAFTGGVLERSADGRVRLAPVGDLLLRTGTVGPPPRASAPVVPPPLSRDVLPEQPSSARTFVLALAVATVLLLALAALAARDGRRRRGSARHAAGTAGGPR
ncbi:hypothetical protein NUM3379_17970 [Kineococcus sp. NUM-3379]